MSEESINTINETSPDVFEMIATTMIEFREEMEYFDGIGTRIAARTRFIMRIVFTTLILSSIYLVFMIFQMATNMSSMTIHLEDMYSKFGTMSQDMSEIAKMVGSMGSNITGIPVIAESMIQIDGDVSTMRGSVYEMNQSIAAIDGEMVRINSNMHEMTGSLSNMNHSVNSMSYDVNEMSLPMNSGPLSGFWPRQDVPLEKQQFGNPLISLTSTEIGASGDAIVINADFPHGDKITMNPGESYLLA